MTPEEVYSCVEFLSKCYGIPAPKVIITDDIPPKYAACYTPNDETISIRPRALTERVVIHEFAHHLQKIFNLPDEHRAEEFEEIADCQVCSRVLPTPDMRLGSTIACPWCGSLYKRV